MGIGVFLEKNAWVVAAVQLERYVASACILFVIICKLSHREESGPIILLEIDKDPKIGFHCTILTFGLAVSLRIKHGKEAALDAEKVTER